MEEYTLEELIDARVAASLRRMRNNAYFGSEFEYALLEEIKWLELP